MVLFILTIQESMLKRKIHMWKQQDWDWEIDPVGMRYLMRYMDDHYHLPMVITENGYGAHESVAADGKVHDPERIKFLKEQIYQIGLAIEDGAKVFGYNPGHLQTC